MARIRTIKPEFFTSLTIADLPLSARLTFIGLWTHVDDDGRCVDEPRLVRAAVWPLDDLRAADVEADLRLLHDASLIVRYEAGGRRYLAVRSWREHQRIDKPRPSKLPAPEDGTEWTYGDPEATSANPSTSGNADFADSSQTPPGQVDDTSRKRPGNVPVGKEQGKEQGREGNGEGGSAGEVVEDVPPAEPSAPEPPQTIPAPDDVDESFDMAPIDRDGFKLEERHLRWAAATVPGIDVHHATALFVAHFRAQGSNRPNWFAEWQKWLIRESKYASERAAKAATGAGNVLPFGSRPSTTDQRVLAAREAGRRVQAILDARKEQQA